MAASVDGDGGKRHSVKKPSSTNSSSSSTTTTSSNNNGNNNNHRSNSNNHGHRRPRREEGSIGQSRSRDGPASVMMLDRSSNSTSSRNHVEVDDEDDEILSVNQVLKDGEEVILKQFSIRQIKREYSKSTLSGNGGIPDRPKSTSGLMTLSGVDWGGMVSAAAHNSNKNNKCPSNKTTDNSSGSGGGKVSHRSRRRLDSADEVISGRSKSVEKGSSKRGTTEGSIRTRRLSLQTENFRRSQSADSALSPKSGNKRGDKIFTSRRMSARNLLNTDVTLPDKSTSRSRRVLQSEMGSIDENGNENSSSNGVAVGGGGGGGRSGRLEGGSGQKRSSRRATSKDRPQRADSSNAPRRPRSERIPSTTRPQRNNSDGRKPSATRGSTRTTLATKNKNTTTTGTTTKGKVGEGEKRKKKKELRNSRSESPGTERSRTKSKSPHAAAYEPSSSTRGIRTAAASTSLDRRPNTSINQKPRSTRRGSFDPTQTGNIAKQKSIKW
mmetsp:Transcript_52059/g.125662  ORF Transcript_52059/g.125662 Transcript_52059/m.125662 type:complete len:495 (-) Transcript_52059:2774-4258(-)